MKKLFLVKSLSAVCVTTFLVSAITYNLVRLQEPQVIDFSAFKNASANIQFITVNQQNKAQLPVYDVSASIVSVIEKEIKAKIRHTRYSLRPKKIFEEKIIAKRWNDIKPEFVTVDLKIEPVKLNALTMDSEKSLFEFEINNNELIRLYGFELGALEYKSFANTQIVHVYDIKEDEVQVAQASTRTQLVEEIVPAVPAAPPAATKEEIAASELATNANPVNDELVVFDYSAKEAVLETTKMKKIFDTPISNTVKEAIERAVHKSPARAMNTHKKKVTADASTSENLEKVMEDEDNLVFDYSQNAQAAVTKKDVASEISAFTAPATPDTTAQAEFTIKAQEINLNTLKSRQAYGYEFVPDYDRSERTDDQATGEIKLGYSLSGNMNTQTGIVQSQGMIPTRVELNLVNEGMIVPMLNEEGIQKFLEKKQTDVVGNLLMVAVDPSIFDVEIDSSHQFKLFLSEKFKLMDTQANAAYVLFLGVKTGNVSLRYLLANKESAQKVVYVGDGEMYFEDPDFVNTQREIYTFTTRSLLGRKVKELNINGSEVSFFGTKTTAKKKALNAYEIKVPEMVENSRKYLEFKHLGNSFFVGTENTTEIEIPGRDFMGKVLEVNELSELGTRCMVQLNLSKDLRDIKANGKNMQGEMFVEATFLDNDGNFSRDNSELSEKIFLSGDMEGLFNVRLDYTDGSTEFLKTFCSEGAYLVEQL